MLFLSFHPSLSTNSYSYSRFHISSSLPPNSNNGHNHQHTSTSPSDVPIKAPIPPWMKKGPLLLQPHELFHLSNPKSKKFKPEKHELSDKALMGKEVRGKRAMKKIVERVEKLHKTQNSYETRVGSLNVENFGGYLKNLKENDEVRTKGENAMGEG